MALTKHTRTIQIDSPSREQSSSQPPHVDSTLPVIELWYGDITQPGAITTEDIIVLSSNSADTLIGNNSIHSWMKALPNTPQKWFDFYPSLNARAVMYDNSGVAAIPIGAVLFWDPTFGPLLTSQAAPYKTDDIFKGAQAMWGNIPKSILIPLQIGDNGFCDSTIMLQSLLHSAIKIGGWHKYLPTTIKIVINMNDSNATNVFETIASNYDLLRGASNKEVGTRGPSGFPSALTKPYFFFMNESNQWMKNQFDSVSDLNPITEFQAFAINLYTTSYCAPMQEVFRKPLKNDAIAPLRGSGKELPEFFGVGYTDLGDPSYQAMIPLFAVFSAGLLNISAYNGITYRGESSLWNSFVVGTGVRILTYMSSADEFNNSIGLPGPQYRMLDDSGKASPLNTPATSPPCGTYYQVRMQSLSAKNISHYSAHQYEREHVYDHEFIEYVTSNEAGVLGSMGGNIASIEIPEIFSPLF
jgi:hypothetical protein